MIVGALACDWRRGEVEQVVEAERENGEGGGFGVLTGVNAWSGLGWWTWFCFWAQIVD